MITPGAQPVQEHEVKSLCKGMARDLSYNPDGTVVEMEEAMNPADLPAPSPRPDGEGSGGDDGRR